jgi:hypothetical protein
MITFIPDAIRRKVQGDGYKEALCLPSLEMGTSLKKAELKQLQ